MTPRSLRSRNVVALIGLLVLVGASAYACIHFIGPRAAPPPIQSPAAPAELAARIHEFCGACHAYPTPDSFPRKHWRSEVERGYSFFEKSGMPLTAPPINHVIGYYEQLAPEELPQADFGPSSSSALGVHFERLSYPGPAVKEKFAVSNVNLVHLPRPGRKETRAKEPLDVIATDMRAGLVMLLRPYEDNPAWTVIADHGKNKNAPSNPAHTEVVDLDGDGILDIVVADLGSFPPTDQHCGRVVWLRGMPDGSFTPITLLENVGRVADVRPIDTRMRGKGKLDLIVAVFGWQAVNDENVGVFMLENHTTDWDRPRFDAHRLDARHGAIHVPVVDLDGDGRPDFVVLLAQEHEAVVAFLNQGDGTFQKKTLYEAPDPSYGSSGIQIVDLDGDGKLDVLYTNGDTLDEPYLFKPYHAVRWLRNMGGLRFEHQLLTPMYGVHRAVAGDFFGDGKKHVAAVSFLPHDKFPDRGRRNADAVILLKQVATGRFERYSLETVDCDHVTCAAGDVYGTGRTDLVVGNFSSRMTDHPVTIWKNRGTVKNKKE